MTWPPLFCPAGLHRAQRDGGLLDYCTILLYYTRPLLDYLVIACPPLFWPQDFIVRKGAAEGESPRVGVVLKVNHDERMAQVMWRLSEDELKRAAEYAAAAGGEGAVAMQV